MHVLVIGGNRFVGRLLGRRLLDAGHRLTLFNRGTLLDPFGDRAERLVGNRATSDLERLLAGRWFDACVDFAAFSGADGRSAAKILRGRVGHHVMISTGQVYLVRVGSSRPARQPAREEDYDGPVIQRPEDPGDHWDWEYGIGKRACEDALALAHAADGFPATRVRIPMVNGERDHFRRIEGYLWRLVDGGPVILPDGGTHVVRHVCGDEVARFLGTILGRPETFGRAYNLAQDEVPTLVELVARMRDLARSRAEIVPLAWQTLVAAGLDPVRVSPFSDRWTSFLDPSRARRELGFLHEPLEAYLDRMVASFLANPPEDRPDGYAGREAEKRLAARA